VGGVDALLMLAAEPWMAGDERPAMVDVHRPLRPPLDLDALPYIGGGHRVAVGLHGHQAIPGDGPQQAGLQHRGGTPAMVTQALFDKRLGPLAEGGLMPALVGHRDHPVLRHRVDGLPAGKRAALDEAALDGP
jgi:hypothetical protein